MPGSVARPSTANTMCLVLKPKTEQYNHIASAAALYGSESEREAFRKNRVIQMKLGAYLSEIQVQQQSCARLLKTEEYRFMQEATRRSSVPRSVEMLQQLNFYRQKFFPRTRYNYGSNLPQDGYPHLHPQHHGIHKHQPLSARPLRPQRQPNGFNRPKTSATIYRKMLDMDPDNDLPDAPPIGFEQSSLFQRQLQQKGENEQVFELLVNPPHQQQPRIPIQQPLRQTTELPAINIRDNFENISPQDSFAVRVSTPKKSSQRVDSARKLNNDTNININKAPFFPKTPFATRQRTDSTTASLSKHPSSIQRMNSVSKINTSPDHPSQQPQQQQQGKIPDEDRQSIESLPVNPNNAIITDNDDAFENDGPLTSGPYQSPEDIPTTIPAENNNALTTAEDDLPVISDVKLDFPSDEDLIDFEIHDDDSDTDFLGPVEKQPKKPPVKSVPKKASFNRINTQPVMPLRHNITSVLRQERARYEANQLKVKDYIHKMASRDTISRSNPRELSAPSRKPSARLNDSRKDSYSQKQSKKL